MKDNKPDAVLQDTHAIGIVSYQELVFSMKNSYFYQTFRNLLLRNALFLLKSVSTFCQVMCFFLPTSETFLQIICNSNRRWRLATREWFLQIKGKALISEE